MAEAFLQTVEKALKVLETIATTNEGELGVKDVSERLGLARSTAHRILSTLEKLEYVVQNQKTGKYKSGVKLIHIGANILMNMSMVKECRPYLEELSNLTGETSHLSIYNHGVITFVDKVIGNNPAKIASIIGQNRPAYASASGKVLLSFLPQGQLQKFLEKTQFQSFTPHSIANKKDLEQCLLKIRTQGYGEDQQEAEEGLVCYAAPVRARNGEVFAAISISGPPSRFTENKDQLISKLIETARKASIACGWVVDFSWR
ncbi:Transcriptional regulator KdgR [Sporomusa silvacetica DSM 10669]|uniref:Transcriptional regulator KdgR n=1 Tax=Sporomusa silvacetica DSM 10669 TaxID=1123289 RepID=A0ABZ3IVE7_9FIRM|nr:IclR family transcriptional regulator [Sporomusa silvacetica]OZC14278.1 transcriptional regulator KdgR [Sporomusa silvacetica DSM 10669]